MRINDSNKREIRIYNHVFAVPKVFRNFIFQYLHIEDRGLEDRR
jgi:hypothetical protein